MKRRNLSLYLLLAPYLVGVLLLIVIPTAISIGLAFTSYDSLSAPVWAGLDNFVFISTYQAFLYGARNTIGFIVLAVPLRIVAMLALALLMREPRRGTRLFRIAIYLPAVIPDVVYALLWTWIFNPLWGPVNLILQLLKLPTPAWIVDRNTVGWILVVMSLFQIGEGFVVMLAGLHDIPHDYYQSAAIDGATRWQSFRYVTLPLLAPWLVLLTFRDIAVGAQNIFTPAFLMMGGSRAYAAWFLPQMIYEEAFGRFRFGVASAVMVTWLVIAGILFWLAFRILRGWGYASEL
jgi:multiple sugar transport system permease protein